MATITITIGPISSSIEITDKMAQEILLDYAAAYKLPTGGNPQTRLDSALQQITSHVQDVANSHSQLTAAEEERERKREELSERRWVRGKQTGD